MPMTERVRRLRQLSQEAVPTISAERALLITEFYESGSQELSPAMTRACAFNYLLQRKRISIDEGELIVGERGPAPKATPTYPEICCHSLEDLHVLNTRERTRYLVDEETRIAYRDRVIPFWETRNLRERIIGSMDSDWIGAYSAGVFTEFMEQRSPGHTALDDKIYKRGLRSFISQIECELERLDRLRDPDWLAKSEQLRAMGLVAQAIIGYAERYAAEAEALAAVETDAARRGELERIAKVCRKVPANAPESFHEALQAYWFVHLAVITELNTWDAFSPGRLDQHLIEFFRQGLADGSLSPEGARELLQCLWIKFNNQPAPPKIGVTAEESSTYNDFVLINTGGQNADGGDGVNELSYLILDVVEEMRLLQPGSCILVSRKNPDMFIKRAARIIRTGYGQPSVFNHDAIIVELIRQGKRIQDARTAGASGCVEAGVFGKENYNLTGYLNLPKILEITLNGGVDPCSGSPMGVQTGQAASHGSFSAVMLAFQEQLRYFIDTKIGGSNTVEQIYAKAMPTPVLSLLIDDCILEGKDYHDGGARYDSSYIQAVGIATLADSLAAIRYHVFDEGGLDMDALLAALRDDFAGHELLRQRLLHRTPKYGNDDDYVDSVVRECFESLFNAVDGRANTRGGRYRINFLPTTAHVYFGSRTGATADGRRRGAPLSDGISPVQGADRNGPTAVLKSAAKLDHLRTGGTLLNQKFSPQLFQTEKDLDNLVALIRSYFRLDGHHIQFNVVDAETLRAAKDNPEAHRSLMVRVAGYSDYFCDLTPALQEEIISRTEQVGFS